MEIIVPKHDVCLFIAQIKKENWRNWMKLLHNLWFKSQHTICAFLSHVDIFFKLNISIMMNNKYNNQKNCLHKYLCFAFTFLHYTTVNKVWWFNKWKLIVWINNKSLSALIIDKHSSSMSTHKYIKGFKRKYVSISAVHKHIHMCSMYLQ